MREVNERAYSRDLELNGGGERLEICKLLFANNAVLVADTYIIFRRLVIECT